MTQAAETPPSRMQRPSRRLTIAACGCSLAVLALLFALFAAFRAQHSLSRAAAEIEASGQILFTLRPLDPAARIAANPGFEPVASSPDFISGTAFAGDVYLAGPAGLSQFTPDGTLRRSWRTGLQLPAPPLTQVVLGRLRGASTPQLLLATEGAGVLILTPGEHPQWTQLLPAPLAARTITALLSTPSGDLLLGTRGAGLLIFNGATLEPAPIHLASLNASTLQITALASAGPAAWLAGTRNAGLLYAHAGTVDRIAEAQGLPDDEIESLVAANGKAFAGTPVGVAEIDLTEPSHPIRQLAPGVFAHRLALASDASELRIGTLDQGILTISLADRPILRRTAFEPTSTARIDAFLTLPGAPLYALSDGTLVHTAESTALPPVWPASQPSTLTDANISALAFTPDGRLFIGFFNRGLDELTPDASTPTGVSLAHHFEDDHLFCIDRLALDPIRQTIAAATANGLVLFDSAGLPRQTLTRRDGLIADHINDLVFTPTGAALATPAGITFLDRTPDPTGPTSLYAFQGLVNNHVYALALSPDPAQLLAGTLGGLSLLHAESVQRNLTIANSTLKHNWITALAPLPQGGWLVGTYGAGLERMTPDGRFESIDLPPNAPRDLIINPNALLVTPRAIYAGTLAHGLLVFSAASGRWTLLAQGLPSLNVTAFAQHAGELYIGTQNGLVRIPEAALDRYLNGADPQ